MIVSDVGIDAGGELDRCVPGHLPVVFFNRQSDPGLVVDALDRFGLRTELTGEMILRRFGQLDLCLRRTAGRLRERVDMPAGGDVGRDHQHGGAIGGRGRELGGERHGIVELRIAFEAREWAATWAAQLVAQTDLVRARSRSRRAESPPSTEAPSTNACRDSTVSRVAGKC